MKSKQIVRSSPSYVAEWVSRRTTGIVIGRVPNRFWQCKHITASSVVLQQHATTPLMIDAWIVSVLSWFLLEAKSKVFWMAYLLHNVSCHRVRCPSAAPVETVPRHRYNQEQSRHAAAFANHVCLVAATIKFHYYAMNGLLWPCAQGILSTGFELESPTEAVCSLLSGAHNQCTTCSEKLSCPCRCF